MEMIELTAALADLDNNPTSERISFQLDDSLIDMYFNQKYYFLQEDGNFLSQIVIEGKVYVDIRENRPHRMIKPE